MTREEATERFNALPRGIRITIIANDLAVEIQWLLREKNAAIEAHAANLKRLNDRIKRLEKSLSELKED